MEEEGETKSFSTFLNSYQMNSERVFISVNFRECALMYCHMWSALL